ncbi:Succinyl-CoA:(R)-benzylsuccinate CoA-transferase subunit BbsF [Luteitalea pratensis]|uniref:Succinyl-CoA:(R)-benzylsuccinate CoA-transferase subunit BbsF n=1 Tax=Luteitalea pratensis TaxID=1855912 RepID=A0A143PP60_LUTPR|nr:CaiB/BaiF CoA-transferase family protein [Luteitalea pratensis]AMY09908.1 Succinyl-CoA:(R)-benzylsuccinate CoA-transferase subunit BbsF [Luteitalea pratensis]
MTAPLEGLRVLELGQLIAGPFSTMLLGYFGADVIKVEPPDGGDPLRTWRHVHNGTALWWYAMGRNKRCITADLRHEEARALIRRLVEQCDVVVENFRPGRLEAWGLGYDVLKAINPRLIMVRISGFGQTGPYAHRPGFAAVAEGMGGLRYVNGFPDRPPARANLSLGDTIGGLHAVLGLLLALHHRDGKGTGEGQVVDVALYESIFNLMESTLPEYATAGVVRERHGSTVSGIVPTNVYPCADGRYIIIGGNADSIFRRLMRAIERPDLAEDPRLATNDGRVPHASMIDQAIAAWTSVRPYESAFAVLEAADVPCGPIYSVADQLGDPHFVARGLIEHVTVETGEEVTIPAIAPQLSSTPGRTTWPGPPLGAHNAEVYGGMLGLTPEAIADLVTRGVI